MSSVNETKRLPYTFPLKLFRYYVMSCPTSPDIQLAMCAKVIYEAYVKDLLKYLPTTYAEMTRRAIENYIDSVPKGEKYKVEAWKYLVYVLAVLWDRERNVFGEVEFDVDTIYRLTSS